MVCGLMLMDGVAVSRSHRMFESVSLSVHGSWRLGCKQYITRYSIVDSDHGTLGRGCFFERTQPKSNG